jgi:hypothetical protein
MLKPSIQHIIVILMLISSLNIHSQYTYDWTAQFGGSNTDFAYAVAVDNEGNVITGGEFLFTVDFDPSEETEANITSVGLNNGYISKLDANGNYVWAQSIAGNSVVLDVHTDNQGNVFACGNFNGTIDFLNDDGLWVFTSQGMYDAFLVKYSPLGELIWAFTIGGIDQDHMNNIATDDEGNLIVCGEFTSIVDFDPGANVAELDQEYVSNAWDAYVAKYDNDGNFIWARQFAGESVQMATGVSLTGEGDIVFAGYFSELTDFDPGAGEVLFTNGADLDWEGFVVKLNEDGNLIWAKSFGGINHEWLYGMAVDEQDNVYVTGAFKGTPDFDPGDGVFEMTAENVGNDPYILKLDSSGDFIWAIQFAGLDDGGSYAIDVVQGAIYTAGYSRGTCDFDPSVNVANETSGAAGYYGFIAVHDTQGAYLWSDRIGNGANDFCYAVVADQDYVYASGSFRGTSVWFGNDFFHAVALDDAYVTKIQHPIVDDVIENDESFFSIYPNPTDRFFTISGLKGNTEIRILDMAGKELIRKIVSENYSINTEDLSEGMYLCVIEAKMHQEVKSFVISR